MIVNIPTPLRSYTGGQGRVEATGGTLAAVLEALDARYPGLRFRIIDEQDHIREHIKLFVGYEQAHRLEEPVPAGEEVHIICALSGG